MAAGGLYMQSEFNQLKNKRLQEFGLQVQTVRAAEGWKRMLQKKGSKEKLLPNRYFFVYLFVCFFCLFTIHCFMFDNLHGGFGSCSCFA